MVEEAVKSYRVAYERDESGWWVATVRGVRGCHTQGRTVDEAREQLQHLVGTSRVGSLEQAHHFVVADHRAHRPHRRRLDGALAARQLERGGAPSD